MAVVIDQLESTVDPAEPAASPSSADAGHKPPAKPAADLVSDLRRMHQRQARLRAD